MDINIRREEPKDYRKVEEVTREAFWNLYFPGCEEHLVVHKIRNHEDCIKELCLVIEIDGEIVGSIFYTKSKIIQEGKEDIETITFGPVSIHPKWHRQGMGKKLITYSIEKAKDLGYRVIIILGYPFHYEPYGFLGGKKYNVSMPDGNYYKGFQILPLYDGALDGVVGYASFSDVFEVTKEDVENYDKGFPPKEKEVKESQSMYLEFSTMLDE